MTKWKSQTIIGSFFFIFDEHIFMFIIENIKCFIMIHMNLYHGWNVLLEQQHYIQSQWSKHWSCNILKFLLHQDWSSIWLEKEIWTCCQNSRKQLQNSFEISIECMEKRNFSILFKKKTGNQWYPLKMMEYQHKNNVK